MDKYERIPGIQTLGSFPEVFWRNIYRNHDIQSILDVGSGHSGVHDCGQWTARKMTGRKATCDIHKCRQHPPCWECFDGIDVCQLTKFFQPKSFDLVQCFEALEHVTGGTRLALEQLCSVASKVIMISSANLAHHTGPGQEAAVALNPHQAYIEQPKIEDLEELGFNIALVGDQRSQIVAWKYL